MKYNVPSVGFKVQKRAVDPGSADRLRFSEGFFGRFFKRLSPGVNSKMKAKMAISAFTEGFFLVKFFKRFADNFLKTRVRSTCAGILCFGFLSTAFSLMDIILGDCTEAKLMQLALCFAISLGAALLCLSGKLWWEVLSTGVFGRMWLVGLGCYRTEELRRKGEHQSSGFAVFIGVILGILSFFVSPVFIVKTVFTVVTVLQIFFRPELGLSLAALTLCFLDTLSLAALTACVLIAYIFKAARGKRVIKFGPEDIFVLLLFLLWLTGAFFGFADPVSVYLGFGFYIIFAKLIGGKEQIRRLSGIFIISLIAFCLVALVWGDTVILKNTITDAFFRYAGAVSKPFEVSLDVIMMLLPVVAVSLTKSAVSRVAAFVALAAGLFTLLFCVSPGALFCFAISVLVLAVLLKKRLLPLLFALVLSAGIGVLFYPGIFSELLSGFVPLVEASLVQIGEGIGYIFSGDIVSVLFGSTTAPEIQLDFWADMLYRFGVLGLAVFVAAAVVLLRKTAGALRLTRDKRLSAFIIGSLISLLILMVRGITADIADDRGVFCFFWMITGTLCGACNAAVSDADQAQII